MGLETLSGRSQRSASSLLNESLHHRCPHHFLSNSAFFHSAATGKHGEKRTHFQNAQDSLVLWIRAVGFHKAVLNALCDVAVAERIFLERFDRGQECSGIIERRAPHAHLAVVADSDSLVAHHY